MKPIQDLYHELRLVDDAQLIHARVVQFPRIEIVFRKYTPFTTVAQIKDYVDRNYPIHRLQIGEYVSPSHARHLTLYMEVKTDYHGA